MWFRSSWHMHVGGVGDGGPCHLAKGWGSGDRWQAWEPARPSMLEQILREFKEPQKAPPMAPGEGAGNRAGALRKELAPVADRAAAAKESLERTLGPYDTEAVAMAAVRVYQWMLEDPEAALAALRGAQYPSASEIEAYATRMFLGEVDTDRLVELARDPDTRLSMSFYAPDLAGRLLASGIWSSRGSWLRR
ncbi:MAG: hypothetical protein QM755_21850 [Luteolibacter sp.]